MNKQEDQTTGNESNELQAHYDFDYSKAKPNRFAAAFNQERVVVVLDPDVAAIFPTSESVNETLRVLATALKNLPNLTSDQPSSSATLPVEAQA